MSEPLLTLVLCYYNERDYLPATLASLTAQRDKRFVLRLVDNRSDDGSEELDRVEAWRFCQDFLREKVNKANFEEMYLLTDKDESGSLSKEEIALFMTKICRRV